MGETRGEIVPEVTPDMARCGAIALEMSEGASPEDIAAAVYIAMAPLAETRA